MEPSRCRMRPHAGTYCHVHCHSHLQGHHSRQSHSVSHLDAHPESAAALLEWLQNWPQLPTSWCPRHLQPVFALGKFTPHTHLNLASAGSECGRNTNPEPKFQFTFSFEILPSLGEQAQASLLEQNPSVPPTCTLDQPTASEAANGGADPCVSPTRPRGLCS